MPVTKKAADHVVARICGIKEGDNTIDAARKAIEVMKDAGFPAKDIKKAEAMLEAAIKRGVR